MKNQKQIKKIDLNSDNDSQASDLSVDLGENDVKIINNNDKKPIQFLLSSTMSDKTNSDVNQNKLSHSDNSLKAVQMAFSSDKEGDRISSLVEVNEEYYEVQEIFDETFKNYNHGQKFEEQYIKTIENLIQSGKTSTLFEFLNLSLQSRAKKTEDLILKGEINGFLKELDKIYEAGDIEVDLVDHIKQIEKL